MRDQRGFTLIELMVSISMSLVVLAAVFAITTSVLRHQDRIVRRVDANSRGRPVMTHIVQGLHSACVTSHIVPVRTGSTGTSIDFLSKAGSAPGLQPDLHRVTLTGSSLTETLYGPSNNIPPDWGGFTTQVSPPTTLLTNVSAPSGVVFRYYRYLNGALSTTPLPTPLSSSDAALTSYVTVSFMSQPGVIDGSRRGVNTQDPNSPLMMNSGVDLRLENAGQYPNQDNLPCV
jgi:prepilin-type N-terminal cleavage/methylation domain-containing protein